MRLQFFILVFGLAALGLGACGEAEPRDELREEIAADLHASAGGMVDEAEADCAAGVLIEVLGRENAPLYVSAMGGDIDAAIRMERITMEQQEAMAEGLRECGAGTDGSP